MPRPIVSTLTGASTGAWLPVDRHSPLTSITVVVNGTTNYTVQHTLDDVLVSTAAANAFDHDTLVAQTTNQDGNYAFPVSAIRVVNNSGAGSTTITILQSGTT
jgi:archaellum component FlaF (FlaF/FlaG flagellin family)